MDDLYARISSAAHDGALGLNNLKAPTLAQQKAGNYRIGRLMLNGLAISIEQPRNSYREGTDPNGVEWRCRMAADYGYIRGYRGADGDNVDIFIGLVPESDKVFVINQVSPDTGEFDEHKVMMGFMSEAAARQTYLESYSRGWKGLGSIVPCTLSQLKWWLKNGDLTRPISAKSLPYDGHAEMNQWDTNANPVGTDMTGLMYKLRQEDEAGLLLDAVTVGEVLEDADAVLEMDALVTPYSQVERKMGVLQAVMNGAGDTVKPVAMQVTDPFKQAGTTNVAAVFELSDGQTVSIFFHNPDTTPTKIKPQDDLISWKWMLNKKDITLLVAPENGADLNVREVARRIMKVAEKNSPRFAQANKNRAERLAAIAGLKTDVESKEAELASLTEREAELQAQLAAKQAEPVISTGDEGIDAMLAEAQKQYKAAVEAGLSPITSEQFMQDVNNDNRSGYSVAVLTSKLAELKSDLAGVTAGTVTPRSIVGTGGTKKAAIGWLTQNISQVETALSLGGFAYHTNISNYQYYLRDLLRGAGDTTFVSDEEREAQRKAADEVMARREAEQAAMEEKAAKGRSYEVGSADGMRKPFELKFTIPVDTPTLLADLYDLPTPQEKYEYLEKKSLASALRVKQKELSFSEKIDLNRALKDGKKFQYFRIEPRAGYSLATITIDLEGRVDAPAAESVDLDQIKAVFTDTQPMDGVPADWIIMNAPRPLVGDKLMEGGDFLDGRFYAAIDPNASTFALYVNQNVKSAAAIVMVIPKDKQAAMAISGTKYEAQYKALPAEQRTRAVQPLINKLQGKTYGELKALLASAQDIQFSAVDEADSQFVADAADGKVDFMDAANIDRLEAIEQKYHGGELGDQLGYAKTAAMDAIVDAFEKAAA